MIDFGAVIRHLGPQAVALQLEEAKRLDSKALVALQDRAAAGRLEIVRNWLREYQVFQGIDGPKRTAITEAILTWADSLDTSSDLSSTDGLVIAHTGLMRMCSVANGKGRDFTSLASKALWLRYPDAVPMFDSFAQRALWVISKIERDIAPLAEEKLEYRKFVLVWTALYRRYASALAAVDMKGYPYRVRIFDKILWLIGIPDYNF